MHPYYETSDFHLAITLHALGFTLAAIDRSDYKRSVFKFTMDKEIYPTIDQYFRDELSLNPRLVLLSAKMLKDRLHSGA
jgi:hypothetical protein